MIRIGDDLDTIVLIPVPDDDTEARKKGFSEEIVSQLSPTTAITEGQKVYVRQVVYERVNNPWLKPEAL